MALAHHEHITHLIDHTSRKRSVFEVIVLINNNQARFYTLVGNRKAYVEPRTENGRQWVQTHADGYWNNNLLALPRRAA